MARPGTCSTVPETTKTTKFEESRHRPAMRQDGVMWQVNLRGSKPGIAELYEGHDGATGGSVGLGTNKKAQKC